MKTKLTKGEQEILLDRPQDCIAQTLADSEIDITEEQANKAFPAVEAMVQSGELDSDKLFRVEQEVLEDMAAGSTFFADMEDGPNPMRMRALLKSAASLEEKLSRLLGRKVEIPTW